MSVVELLEFVGLVVVGTGAAGLSATTDCGAGLIASIVVGNGLGGCGLGVVASGVLLLFKRLLRPAEYADQLNTTRNIPTHFID